MKTNATPRQRRGLPVGDRVLRVLSGGRAATAAAVAAEAVYVRPGPAPEPVLPAEAYEPHAGTAALEAALSDGRTLALQVELQSLRGVVDHLRADVEERDDEIRRLRIAADDAAADRERERAEAERRIEEAVREARHQALGTARRHVAGYELTSILED